MPLWGGELAHGDRPKEAVAQVDSSLNAHIVALLRWLVHDADQLPLCPDCGANLTR